MKRQYRSYQIPDAKVGFYGTGINKVSVAQAGKLEKLIEPVQEYFTNLLEIKPVRLSLRYLGYHDEINIDNLRDARAKILPIYKKYLPITVKVIGLSENWKKHPRIQRQFLLADVKNEKVTALHKELLKLTTVFPIFQAVEGNNFQPHITLAELKPKYHKNIPPEVEKYIKSQKLDIDITFKGAYVWGKRGPRQLI